MSGVPADSSMNMEDVVFDADFYHEKYPDLQNAFHHDNEKLRKHWHEYGIKEGRACSPVLDLKFYLEKYPDLQSAFGQDYARVYHHFFEYGINENRQASALYDPNYYRKANPALSSLSNRQLIWHFINQGYRSGLKGSNADCVLL